MTTKDTFKELQVTDTYKQHSSHKHFQSDCSTCFSEMDEQVTYEKRVEEAEQAERSYE